MREGDVIGHEYMGEVVEVGSEADGLSVGDRVVVPSFLGCGKCWYCEHDEWSLCDNTHPKPELQEPVLGYPTGGIPGYSHAFGGYAGSHAEYIREAGATWQRVAACGRVQLYGRRAPARAPGTSRRSSRGVVSCSFVHRLQARPPSYGRRLG